MKDFHSFPLSDIFSICSPFEKDTFTEHGILGWRFFSFSPLINKLLISVLHGFWWEICFQSNHFSLQISCHFFPHFFQNCFVCVFFVFRRLTMICLYVEAFLFILSGIYSALGHSIFMSFTKLRCVPLLFLHFLSPFSFSFRDS
jgi:hypothetical protein